MRLFMYAILFIFCQTAFAIPPATSVTAAVPTLSKQANTFDIKEANKEFDKLNIKLSTENLRLETLSHAIKTLNKLIANANDCVETNEKRISTLDEQIQQSVNSSGTNANATPLPAASAPVVDANKSAADLVYLNTERKKLTSQLSQCRLFSIRAKEAVDAYTTAIAKLKHEETFARGLPLWSIVKETQALSNDTPLISANMAWPAKLLSPWIWGIMVASSVLIASLCMLLLRRQKWVTRYMRIRSFQISTLFIFSVFLLCCMIMGQLKFFATPNQAATTLPLQLMNIISLYVFGLLIITLLFTVKWVRAFFCWYSLDSSFFKSLTIFLFSFYSLAFLAKLLAKQMTMNSLYWQLGMSIFLLAVLATATYFVYYFCHAHKHIPFIKSHYRLIRRVSALLFMGCAAIDILGYHSLAKHLTFGFISTFAVVFFAWLCNQAINKLYIASTHFGVWHNKINALFGYKTHQTPTELFILKITLELCIVASALYLITHFWGYANYYVESVYRQFLLGFHFGNFTFYPTRIVAGVIVFCVLYLLCRALSTRLTKEQPFEEEEETQVAIVSILSYIGFAVALVTGLLIAGFNFTGLAIIAGALSVGIGLGLQSIVNHFVSGIILLIEKPVKPGDRIRVDNIEGIVKKIRVRSTQITTSAREDVIIPNSDLITRPVTNFMYSDKHLSIGCTVTVAYGTDPRLVHDLLLQAAKHDEIIKNARHKPTVFLNAFGENGFIFQVWFLIKDGNHKSNVKSAIHFEIERLFREHHIQFAFPQRDIHVKMTEFKSISEEK